MTSNIPLLLSFVALAAGCTSTGSPSGGASGTSGAESSTGGEASSAASGDETLGESTGPATTTGAGTTEGAGTTTETGMPGDTGTTEAGGETGAPQVDEGPHFRGLVSLADGTMLDFEGTPQTSVNPINDLYFCTADATVDGHDLDVALSWPDTDALVLGESQSWALISAEGPVLRVGIDGPAGSENSLSTAGSVTFVNNGNDDPPSVAGVATIDLDPADDGDLLQSMTEIEFRCPL